MGSSAKQPAQPNPKLTAAAQFKLNRDTSAFEARQNRFNQDNPFGSISWQNTGTDKKPNWSQKTTLSQPQQALYNSQIATQQQAASGANSLMPGVVNRLSTAGYNASNDLGDIQNQLKALPSSDLATRKHVEDALFQRLNPSLQQDEEALRTRLANQGLQYGGEAYGNAMRDNSQRVNDARLAVVGQGGQEMQRAQDMNLARLGTMAGTATDRQQGDAASRNQMLAELSALIQSSGNVNLPTYGGATNVSSIGSPDIAGLIQSNYQGQVSGANAKTASNNAALASALSAAGTVAGAKYGGK